MYTDLNVADLYSTPSTARFAGARIFFKISTLVQNWRLLMIAFTVSARLNISGY
jgi:hypothetical protein